MNSNYAVGRAGGAGSSRPYTDHWGDYGRTYPMFSGGAGPTGPTGAIPPRYSPFFGVPLMKTILDDIKAFIIEHRNIIYFVVILLLVDRFLLGGKLTDRIKNIAENLLSVVEKKIEGKTIDVPAANP